MNTETPEKDLFLDDEFAPLAPSENSTFAQQLEELAKETEPPAPVVEEPAAPTAPPAPPEPEVVNLKDVGVLTIVRTKKGWQGTVDAQDGSNPNVFYGATKEEMYQNIAVSKVHGDRKIREQNRQIKLGNTPDAPKPRAASNSKLRDLTADEVFEIKTQLQSDPSLAFESWFQKRTGMSIDQLVSVAQEGKSAKDDLDAEAIAKAFLQENPDYYPGTKYENLESIVRHIYKHKLHENFPAGLSGVEAIGELNTRGFWSVKNITEAYLDLNDAGLLVRPPAAPAEELEPAEPSEPKVPAAPANERIVRTVRRQRAALGVRPSDTVDVRPPETPKAPSAEEFDNLSDKQIDDLMKSVARTRAQTRR